MPRPKLKDITGQRFGARVAVEYAGNKRWRTRCDCGAEFVTDGADLRRRTYLCNHDINTRFWDKVDKSGSCWVWTGAKQTDGYGSFRNTGSSLAHKFSWEMVKGPVPEGLELDHLCRNRSCVNPEQAVTHHENVLRGDLHKVSRARFGK